MALSKQQLIAIVQAAQAKQAAEITAKALAVAVITKIPEETSIELPPEVEEMSISDRAEFIIDGMNHAATASETALLPALLAPVSVSLPTIIYSLLLFCSINDGGRSYMNWSKHCWK